MEPTCKNVESSYIKPLIDLLVPQGSVLEIGFGQGSCSQCIAQHQPLHHTIIEPDPIKAEQARIWAKAMPHVSVIEESWQSALPLLGAFDAILLNDRFLSPLSDVYTYKEQTHSALRQGKELLSMIAKTFPHLKSLRYSDHDLDVFFQNTGKNHPKEVAYFLSDLKHQGQISPEQYTRALQKYNLQEERSPQKDLSSLDSVFDILKVCLDEHMLPGSRFCCLCSNPTSKYEDARFFEQIITHPDFNYEEYLIQDPISSKDSLILRVEKV